MINLNIKIPKKLATDRKFEQVLKDGLFEATQIIRNQAVKNAPYRSGNLRRSITTDVKGLIGRVGTNVKYAKIQEYGGTIRARNKKYLTFRVNGRWVRTKQVRIKGSRYLTRAFLDNKEQVLKIMKENIENYLQSISK